MLTTDFETSIAEGKAEAKRLGLVLASYDGGAGWQFQGLPSCLNHPRLTAVFDKPDWAWQVLGEETQRLRSFFNITDSLVLGRLRSAEAILSYVVNVARGDGAAQSESTALARINTQATQELNLLRTFLVQFKDVS